MARHPQYFILTGEVRSGKTRLLVEAAKILKNSGLRLNGLACPEHREGAAHNGYDGLNVRSGDTFALARIDGDPGWERSGPYYFLPLGLTLANQAITNFDQTDLTIIDEVGPLEMAGGGLRPGLDTVFRQPKSALIVARRSLVSQLSEMISYPYIDYDIEDKNCLEYMIEDIQRLTK